MKAQLQQENALLHQKLQARDQEIERLHHSYQGGQTFSNVKTGFEKDQQLEQAIQDKSDLLAQMDDIARILGLPDFSRENEVRQRQQGYSGGF